MSGAGVAFIQAKCEFQRRQLSTWKRFFMHMAASVWAWILKREALEWWMKAILRFEYGSEDGQAQRYYLSRNDLYHV